MVRRGVRLQNQRKYPTIPIYEEEKDYRWEALQSGLTNRMSGHEHAASLLEQGKSLGKSEILGFREIYMEKTPRSKPYQMSIDHVAPNLFSKDGFGIIV